jgi:hypothetical protein
LWTAEKEQENSFKLKIAQSVIFTDAFLHSL